MIHSLKKILKNGSTVAIHSQRIHISNHHIIHFNYIIILSIVPRENGGGGVEDSQKQNFFYITYVISNLVAIFLDENKNISLIGLIYEMLNILSEIYEKVHTCGK